MLRSLACVAALALVPSIGAAASYTYDFDFTFAQTGDDVGGFRNEGTGGALTGFFTIDDSLTILDFAFEFEIIQYANAYQPARTDRVSLDFDAGDFFGVTVYPAGGGVPERTVIGFSEVDGSVNCSFRNATGSPYSLSFSAYDYGGGVTTDYQARSARSSPYCNQYGALTHRIGQSYGQRQISPSVSGTLVAPGGGASVVPLPASGLLLLGAFGAAGALRLRRPAAPA
jgi:hypothetical protein